MLQIISKYNMSEIVRTLSDDPVELSEYHSKWLLRFCRRFHEARALLYAHVPLLYEVYERQSDRYAYLRVFTYLFYGLFLSLVFYLLIISDLDMHPTFKSYVAMIITPILAIGCVISSQIRCMSIIVPVRMGSRFGRTTFYSLVVIYLVLGPISSLGSNFKEAMQMISCQTVTSISLTKAKYELLFKPLREASTEMRVDDTDAKNLHKNILDIRKDVHEEVIDMNEVKTLKKENDEVNIKLNETLESDEIDKDLEIQKFQELEQGARIEKSYLRKMKYRCQNIQATAVKKCFEKFQKVQDNCMDKLPIIINVVCYLLNLNFVCNFNSLFGGSICDKSEPKLDDLGSSYLNLENAGHHFDNLLENQTFRIKVKLNSSQVKESVKNAREAAKDLTTKYKEIDYMISLFLRTVSRLTALSFLFILYNSHTYITNFLTDVEEDNSYVTRYFRIIDYRRYIQGKFTLLPLKSSEKEYLCDVYSFSVSKAEKREIIHNSITTLVLFIFSIIFTFVDYFLHSIMDSIEKHYSVEYEVSGHHNFSTDIKGAGFLASVLRSVIGDFNRQSELHKNITNKACLPILHEPGLYNFRLYSAFLLLFLLAVLDATLLRRLTAYVCSIFYPKAQKKRIIFLYNQTLKRRVTYLNYRLDVVLADSKKKPEPEELSFFLVLRLKHPELSKWLRYFKIGKSGIRKCVICLEPEPKNAIIHCLQIHCHLYYCQQCWKFVVKRQCIGCTNYQGAENITIV